MAVRARLGVFWFGKVGFGGLGMTSCQTSHSEAYIEEKVTAFARERGWRQRKVKYIGRRGAPDRWYFRAPGRLRIIEFKDANGRLSPHQKREVAWLRANGFDVHVIDSVEAGVELFEKDNA